MRWWEKSSQTASLYLRSIDCCHFCHSKWRQSIRISVHYSFHVSYVMYCIRSITKKAHCPTLSLLINKWSVTYTQLHLVFCNEVKIMWFTSGNLQAFLLTNMILHRKKGILRCAQVKHNDLFNNNKCYNMFCLCHQMCCHGMLSLVPRLHCLTRRNGLVNTSWMSWASTRFCNSVIEHCSNHFAESPLLFGNKPNKFDFVH